MNFGHGGILKPWKLLEREKVLAVVNEQPESMLGDVRHLNCRSALPRLS